MPEEPLLQLRSVSVVVTAAFHNPSILNPDFLVAHEIVPPSWAVAETLTTPPLSVVKYDNGLSVTVDPSKLTLAEDAGPHWGENHRVHGIGRAYLEKLPHVPYRHLGLNCSVFAPRVDSQRWLVERFAAPWLQNETTVLGVWPRFALQAVEATCYVQLLVAPDGEEGIIAECNVHHDGPLTVDSMCDALQRWQERQAFIRSSLTMLCGATQT